MCLTGYNIYLSESAASQKIARNLKYCCLENVGKASDSMSLLIMCHRNLQKKSIWFDTESWKNLMVYKTPENLQ